MSVDAFLRSPVKEPPFLRGAGAFVLHYMRINLLNVSAMGTVVIGAASCAVATQYVMKMLVDAMAGSRSSWAAQQALGIFICLIAVESLLWRLCGWLGCKTTVGIGVQMRLDLFKFLSGQPMKYFAENLAGSLGGRITATAGSLGSLTNTAMWRIVPPAVDFIGAILLFTLVDWRIALVLTCGVFFIMVGLVMFGRRGGKLHRKYACYANEVGGDLIDIISNMWSVKAFSARSREWERLRSSFQSEAQAQRASWMYTEKARFIHDVALWVMAGGILAWAVALWRWGAVSPGDVVLVSALTFRILHGSRDVALSVVEMAQNFGFIEDTLETIGQRPTVLDHPEATKISVMDGTIEFKNVTFCYDPDVVAIRDINLFIPAGQKVGIVGPSGAGKSTFVHLLQRLYDVQGGDILINGESVARVKQEYLRRSLAVVPQEISLFHRTVMENIRFAKPDAPDHEVFAAARAAHCDGFISRLPAGYDTLVGERGVKVSGGQRQRIGIARAFLKNAPIIILDEATSALDTESEHMIQNSLVQMCAKSTVIAVAHRLSTLSRFDRVLVLNEGRIVEDGSAAELRARQGLFDRMWRMQAEGSQLEAAE